MNQRERLNKLVVFTLNQMSDPPKARELYQAIKTIDPHILNRENVTSFRAFVKVINSFPEVRGAGFRPKHYFLT